MRACVYLVENARVSVNLGLGIAFFVNAGYKNRALSSEECVSLDSTASLEGTRSIPIR